MAHAWGTLRPHVPGGCLNDFGVLAQKRSAAERVGMGRRPQAYSTSPGKCFCIHVEQALSPVPLRFQAVVPIPLGMAKIPIVPKTCKHPGWDGVRSVVDVIGGAAAMLAEVPQAPGDARYAGRTAGNWRAVRGSKSWRRDGSTRVISWWNADRSEHRYSEGLKPCGNSADIPFVRKKYLCLKLL
jgi:hypothetical protein